MFSTLWHQYQQGGWAMWLILFWLICSIAVIVERTVFLFGASINKDVFVATMQKCILAGDVAKAVKMCSAANAPLARIVQAGLVKVNRPDEEVQAGMDEAALREMPGINRRTGFLALFANLAMLCGLFGTIVGLGLVLHGGNRLHPMQRCGIAASLVHRRELTAVARCQTLGGAAAAVAATIVPADYGASGRRRGRSPLPSTVLART